MPVQGRLPTPMRILRLVAAMSLIVAVAAVATIVNGDPPARSRTLVAAAITLGFLALLGMALLIFAYARRKKVKNDPRP